MGTLGSFQSSSDPKEAAGLPWTTEKDRSGFQLGRGTAPSDLPIQAQMEKGSPRV